MFPYNQLERWSFALDSVNKFLDQYTAYIDYDDPKSHR
jgi:phage pi2 protein 07